MSGQLLESVKKTMSNELVQKNSQALSEVDLSFSRTNAQISEMGHFKTTGSPKRKFYKPRRNSRRKLEYKAISNPAPGNKLMIMCLFH